MAQKGFLEPSWSLLERSWELLGASEEHFGDILGLFGNVFGAWIAVSKQFVEILKNLEKRCKVLQKSRFRGSEIHENSWKKHLGKQVETKLEAKLAKNMLFNINLVAERHEVGA